MKSRLALCLLALALLACRPARKPAYTFEQVDSLLRRICATDTLRVTLEVADQALAATGDSWWLEFYHDPPVAPGTPMFARCLASPTEHPGFILGAYEYYTRAGERPAMPETYWMRQYHAGRRRHWRADPDTILVHFPDRTIVANPRLP